MSRPASFDNCRKAPGARLRISSCSSGVHDRSTRLMKMSTLRLRKFWAKAASSRQMSV